MVKRQVVKLPIWQKIISAALLSLCFLASGLVNAETAQATEEVRVLLAAETGDKLSATVETGEYELLDGLNGSPEATVLAGDQLELRAEGGAYAVYINGDLALTDITDIVLSPVDEQGIFRFHNTLYRGELRLVQNGAALYAVNHIGVEQYLYGVIGREIGYKQPLEATKAQAVASRSYALAQLKPTNSYYDLTNTTASQLYGGYTAEKEAASGNVIEAVNATAGQVLCYKGKLYSGFYHSNAGGHTEDIQNVWGGDVPLKGVPSPHDNHAQNSVYSWQVELSAQELVNLAKNANNGQSIGEFLEIRLSTVGTNGKPAASGRIMEATIIGTKGQVSAKSDAVRSLLGGLKSTLFTVESLGGDASVWIAAKGVTPYQVEDYNSLAIVGGGSTEISTLAASGGQPTILGADGTRLAGQIVGQGLRISGRGYGHGVGMSQWGAIGMAAEGSGYQEILAHYFNLNINPDFSLQNR